MASQHIRDELVRLAGDIQQVAEELRVLEVIKQAESRYIRDELFRLAQDDRYMAEEILHVLQNELQSIQHRVADDRCMAEELLQDNSVKLKDQLVPVKSSVSLYANHLDDDRLVAEADTRLAKEDFIRCAHDRRMAEEMAKIPEHEWAKTGDHFHLPFDQSTSQGNGFSVYCKGLVVGESECIGVCICDYAGNVVFEMGKHAEGVGKNGAVAELKAVIEGLTAAVELDLKRVVFCFDYKPLYRYAIGQQSPKRPKIVALVDHVNQIREKIEYSAPFLIAQNDVNFGCNIAKKALVKKKKKKKATCDICLERKEVVQFFVVDNCFHFYCFSCMRQHVEAKLLNGTVVKCPHEGCNTELKTKSCRKFLTPKLIEMMTQRLKETSIPVTKKVYCPYPKCSFLMSKREVLRFSRKRVSGTGSGLRICVGCDDIFCINCKVPWHCGMNCYEYKRRNPSPSIEITQLKTLAKQKFWRQCTQCNHMIELNTGCYHITCRCGYEFCYTCGAEWKDKKATCSCSLWDEQNILNEE